MKSLLLLATTLLLPLGLFAQAPEATDYRLGLGVIAGEPSGLNANLFLGPTTSLQLIGAWSINDDETERAQFSGDLLFWQPEATMIDQTEYHGYVGFGYRYKMQESGAGEVHSIRIPCGVSIRLQDMPVEFFLELVPVLDLSPETTFDWNAGIGLRLLLF